MGYLARHAELRLRLLERHFKVVLVTGARQVGKSTLLRHVFPDVRVVVFDAAQDLYGARRDPDLFLENFPPPIILDEVQYAPELLAAVKRRVDAEDRKGLYLLTGSQNLAMLRSISETMAGRVGILPLEPMTPGELAGQGDQPGWLGVYLDGPDALPDRFAGTLAQLGPLARQLWRGGMPGLLDLPDEVVSDYFRSYVETYVQRDVRMLGDVRELTRFGDFLRLSGALTGQEINAAQLGRDIGVAPGTARKWLDAMLATFQWLELPAYHGSTIKRLSGKRKGLLRDTGLACWLQRITSPEALAASLLLGAVFETAVINHIHGQFVQLSAAPQAYHWRTAGGAEADLVLERDGKLYPVEVKCKTNLTRNDARGLAAFRATYPAGRVMTGLLIHAGTQCYRLDDATIALPWNAVCRPQG